MEADVEGRPAAVTLRPGERLRVAEVQDTWRIDDEWWRERRVSRMYWQVELEDGRVVTVYHDSVSSCWFKQQGCR